jgi:NADH:ubiquinone oxidoreductase subunit 6 (subunit J)
VSDLGTALVFWPSAAIMLVTGLYVFRTSSMARAGLLLLASLGVEGLIFLALASEFLGVLQLLMMSGEMVIMVFFMVMFMADPGGLMGMDMTHDKRRSAAAAALAAVALAAVALATDWPAAVVTGKTPDVRAIGFEVMGRSMVSFLFAGVTILFAMVGGIMLAQRGGRLGLEAPGDDRHAADDEAATAHHGHGHRHEATL